MHKIEKTTVHQFLDLHPSHYNFDSGVPKASRHSAALCWKNTAPCSERGIPMLHTPHTVFSNLSPRRSMQNGGMGVVYTAVQH